MEHVGKRPTYFSVPTEPKKDEKNTLIAELRSRAKEGQFYGDLLLLVRMNLKGLATHRNPISEFVSGFFHVDLPGSMQEAIVILAMVKNSRASSFSVTSDDIKGVVDDLLLVKVHDNGSRAYLTTNESEDNYKHQIIATLEYNTYDNFTPNFNDGIDRLQGFQITTFSDRNLAAAVARKEAWSLLFDDYSLGSAIKRNLVEMYCIYADFGAIHKENKKFDAFGLTELCIDYLNLDINSKHLEFLKKIFRMDELEEKECEEERSKKWEDELERYVTPCYEKGYMWFETDRAKSDKYFAAAGAVNNLYTAVRTITNEATKLVSSDL